jgi:PhnB protein
MSERERTAAEQKLSPYLVVQGAARAIEFYERVFGARELYRLTEPGGKIGHAELELSGCRIMLADEYPDFGALAPPTVGGSPVSLHLYVADVDRVVATAIELGATLLRAVKLEFFGDRTGLFLDPFGHRWHLATRVEPISPEEMQRRWSNMLAEG